MYPVPGSTTIRVTCKGRGCPFGTKVLTYAQATAKANLTSLFNFKKKGKKVVSKLAVKTRVTVEVSVPAALGQYSTYTVRSKKAPKVAGGCLAPGSYSHSAC